MLFTDAIGNRLRFVPDPSTVGTIDPAITFRAWDQTDGNANAASGIDVSVAGGSTAYSELAETASLSIFYDTLTLYQNDFENSAGSEWCFQSRDVTPLGSRNFLGQFGAQNVCLNLDNIAPHQAVSVSFDLYVIRSWNGNRIGGGGLTDPDPFPESDPIIGPDHWQFQADGQTLLDTTFANKAGHPQSYPNAFGQGNNSPATGAVEVNSLGYQWNGTSMDAVYRITITFPHNANTLDLNFIALGLQALENESWGLDNVQVQIYRDSLQYIYLPIVVR